MQPRPALYRQHSSSRICTTSTRTWPRYSGALQYSVLDRACAKCRSYTPDVLPTSGDDDVVDVLAGATKRVDRYLLFFPQCSWNLSRFITLPTWHLGDSFAMSGKCVHPGTAIYATKLPGVVRVQYAHSRIGEFGVPQMPSLNA